MFYQNKHDLERAVNDGPILLRHLQVQIDVWQYTVLSHLENDFVLYPSEEGPLHYQHRADK